MGQFMSRAAPRAVPAAAKVSPPVAAALKPPGPAAAAQAAPPGAEAAAKAEMAQHASIEQLLRQTDISTQTTAAAPKPAATVATDSPSARIDEDQLQALLTLHSQDAARWGSAALADRFALDEGAVSNIVAHCGLFRGWRSDDGKQHAVPMDDPVPPPPRQNQREI